MKYFAIILFLSLFPRLLQAEGADVRMLIIADSRFHDYAEVLAGIHRAGHDMKVAVMDVDHDTPSEELRQKVKSVYDSSAGALEYLLLYGAGWTDGGCDAYHGMVKGAFSAARLPFTAPDVAVGRIPVTDVKQCEEYNAKVLRYLDSMERMLHGNEIIMAADDGDNLSHQNDAEEASAIFASHPEALLHKIYVGEYSVVNGAARGAARHLAESLDAGAGLWVYVGHGNETSITGEGLMDSYVAGVLRNDILPWGFFCSCRIGKFGASSLSFSESLLFNGSGGVIGCVTSPQEVYASYNRQVLTAFARRWADAADDGNFGDIWLAVQKECMLTPAAQANKVLGLNTLSFNLLGDPALPLMRGSRRMDCEYVRQSGCIVGGIDTAADGVDVEAVFYSSAPSRDGVIHDDIIAGKATAEIVDGMCVIPVSLPDSFSGRKCRAVISARSAASGEVWSGQVEFDYSVPALSAARHEPVILSAGAVDGMIEVDVITDGTMPCQNLGEIGAYSRCVIDGKTILPLVLDSSSGYRCRLTASCAALSEGRHEGMVIVVDNGGARTQSRFYFVHGKKQALSLRAAEEIVRERAELRWDGAAPVIKQLLKITDIEGNPVYTAQLNDEVEYCWHLTDNDGERVPSGIYYCHILTLEPGVIGSNRLRIAVLPQ